MRETICWRDKDRLCVSTCEAYNNGSKIEIIGFCEVPTTCLILQALLSNESLMDNKFKIILT